MWINCTELDSTSKNVDLFNALYLFAASHGESYIHTDMCHLTMTICSEKCFVRRFRCANVIECTYACYCTEYCRQLQHKGKYYNIIILRDHRRICGPSLTETSLCGDWLSGVFVIISQAMKHNYLWNTNISFEPPQGQLVWETVQFTGSYSQPWPCSLE